MFSLLMILKSDSLSSDRLLPNENQSRSKKPSGGTFSSDSADHSDSANNLACIVGIDKLYKISVGMLRIAVVGNEHFDRPRQQHSSIP